MKIVMLIALALATGCNSQKPLVATSAKLERHECRQKGNCAIELLKDKALVVKTDDFSSLYHKIEDNQGTTVIRYQFSKGDEEKVPDSGYREESCSNFRLKMLQWMFPGLHCKTQKCCLGVFASACKRVITVSPTED